MKHNEQDTVSQCTIASLNIDHDHLANCDMKFQYSAKSGQIVNEVR